MAAARPIANHPESSPDDPGQALLELPARIEALQRALDGERWTDVRAHCDAIVESGVHETDMLAQIWRCRAMACAQLGAREEALAALETCASLTRPDADALAEIANEQLELGDAESARGTYARALALAPEHRAAALAASNLELAQERGAAAMDILMHCLEADADWPDGHMRVAGIALQACGGDAEAIERGCLWICQHAPPSVVDALLSDPRLGHRPGLDARCAKLTLDRFPDNAFAHRMLGAQAFARGEVERSAGHHQRAFAPHDVPWTFWRWVSMRDYCRERGARVETIQPEEPVFSVAPKIFESRPHAEHHAVDHPDWYLAVLDDMVVRGGACEIFTHDGRAINDMLEFPELARISLQTTTFQQANFEGGLAHDFPTTMTDIERGVFLGGTGASNISHWMVEYLPRLWILNQFEEFADLPLIVDEACTRDDHFTGLLARVDTRSRRLITLPPGGFARVRQLVVPSKLTRMPFDLAPGQIPQARDFAIPSRVVQILRDAVGAPQTRGHRRIYLPRNKRPRRLTNAAEIQAEFKTRGYEFIAPETLTLDEKIRIYGEADVVIGDGSAVTSAVFSPPQTRVGMHVSEAWRDGAFMPTLSSLCGHDFELIAGPVDDSRGGTYFHRDYSIDLEQLRRFLDRFDK